MVKTMYREGIRNFFEDKHTDRRTQRKVLPKKNLNKTCWDSEYVRSLHMAPRTAAQGIDGRCA